MSDGQQQKVVEGAISTLGPPPRAGRDLPSVRRTMTNALLFLLGVQIITGIVFVFWHWENTQDMKDHLDTLKDILTITFGPTVTLLGSAIGFYFGRQGPGA